MLWTYRVILTLAVVLSIKAVENATHPALPYIPSSESNSTHQYPASISHSPPGSPMPTPQPTPTLTHDATKPIQKKVRYKWCPDVLCPILTSKGQDLCLQKWLFILATGRSGSTRYGCSVPIHSSLITHHSSLITHHSHSHSHSHSHTPSISLSLSLSLSNSHSHSHSQFHLLFIASWNRSTISIRYFD